MQTFSILICALNEEKNIGKLLQDILEQEYGSSFSLEKILIISDGSTDGTEEIVEDLKKNHNKIELVKNKKRMGKSLSFNKAKKSINSDYLVLLDADIRLENRQTIKELLKGFNDEKIGLVSGMVKPADNKAGRRKWLCRLSSVGGYFVTKEIIKKKQIYAAHGRIMGIAKPLYKKIKIPDIPGNDQFIYLYARKEGFEFSHQGKAVIYYKTAQSVKDVIKQKKRFLGALKINEANFGEKFYRKEARLSAGDKLQIVLTAFSKKPLPVLVWILAVIYSEMHFYFLKDTKITGRWDVSDSTK